MLATDCPLASSDDYSEEHEVVVDGPSEREILLDEKLMLDAIVAFVDTVQTQKHRKRDVRRVYKALQPVLRKRGNDIEKPMNLMVNKTPFLAWRPRDRELTKKLLQGIRERKAVRRAYKHRDGQNIKIFSAELVACVRGAAGVQFSDHLTSREINCRLLEEATHLQNSNPLLAKLLPIEAHDSRTTVPWLANSTGAGLVFSVGENEFLLDTAVSTLQERIRAQEAQEIEQAQQQQRATRAPPT